MRSRRHLLTLVALTVFFLVACDATKISDINMDPGRYAGKDVTIAGEVVDSYGLLGQGAFEVDDGTGRLWVLSSGFGVPAKGARVGVTGRVEQGLTIGSRSFANILRETQPRKTD
jgi:hypothetical protein